MRAGGCRTLDGQGLYLISLMPQARTWVSLIIMLVGRTSLGPMNGYLALFLVVAIINIITIFVIGKLPAHESLDFRTITSWAINGHAGGNSILGQNAVLGLFDIALGTVTGILFFVMVKK